MSMSGMVVGIPLSSVDIHLDYEEKSSPSGNVDVLHLDFQMYELNQFAYNLNATSTIDFDSYTLKLDTTDSVDSFSDVDGSLESGSELLRCDPYKSHLTADATVNFETCPFMLCGSHTVLVQGCNGFILNGVCMGSCYADTYIRLFNVDDGSEMVSRDGSRAHVNNGCSQLSFSTPKESGACRHYELREGCKGGGECNARFTVVDAHAVPPPSVPLSPTFSPTFAPTAPLGTPTVVFENKIVFEGLSANTMNTDIGAQDAAVEATALAMSNGVTISMLRFVSATDTSTVRLLRQSGRKLATSCDVVIEANIPVTSVTTGSTDPAAVFASLTSSLANAVSSGGYTAAVEDAATNNGVTVLATVSVSTVENSGFVETTVTATPSSLPTFVPTFLPTFAPTFSPTFSPTVLRESSWVADNLLPLIGVALGCLIVALVCGLFYMSSNTKNTRTVAATKAEIALDPAEEVSEIADVETAVDGKMYQDGSGDIPPEHLPPPSAPPHSESVLPGAIENTPCSDSDGNYRPLVEYKNEEVTAL